MSHRHNVKINFCVREKSDCIKDICDFEDIPVSTIE